MRALLRFISMIWLAAAVIAGVADTIQSIAAEKVILTPVLAVWQFVRPGSYDADRLMLQGLPAGKQLSSVLDGLVTQPAFALFLALALVFWMLGYKKPKPAGRFAA